MFNQESFPYANVQSIIEEYHESTEGMLPDGGIKSLLQTYYANRD